MTRLLAAGLAGLLVLLAAPAVAQSPRADARVEGHWSTNMHPVTLVPPGDYSTHYGIGTDFKPKCASGACDVVMTHPTFLGDVRQTLKRHGARYSGSRTIVGDAYCGGHDVRRGANYRMTAVLRVVEVAKDGVSAKRIRGRYTIRGTQRTQACQGLHLLDRSTWKSRKVH